jgi:hypothetical protein
MKQIGPSESSRHERTGRVALFANDLTPGNGPQLDPTRADIGCSAQDRDRRHRRQPARSVSSAYHLRKLDLAPHRGFVVLDQSPKPGGAWQFRWPSLTRSTVDGIHHLPELRLSEVMDTDATEVQASVAVPRYFAPYERTFDLPVYRPVTVKVVCDRGDRLRMETDH